MLANNYRELPPPNESLGLLLDDEDELAEDEFEKKLFDPVDNSADRESVDEELVELMRERQTVR